MNRSEIKGPVRHYEFRVHYADGRTPKSVPRAYREIPTEERLRESARKIAEESTEDGVEVVEIRMPSTTLLWSKSPPTDEPVALRPEQRLELAALLAQATALGAAAQEFGDAREATLSHIEALWDFVAAVRVGLERPGAASQGVRERPAGADQTTAKVAKRTYDAQDVRQVFVSYALLVGALWKSLGDENGASLELTDYFANGDGVRVTFERVPRT